MQFCNTVMAATLPWLHIDLGGSDSPILLPKAMGMTLATFFFFSWTRQGPSVRTTILHVCALEGQ